MPQHLPKITVVTPSFNQGQFLEETIQSVLGQNYDNLEFMILDGGSTDNSVSIIKKYEKHLDFWISEKDNGQGSAINRGFERATGDVLCWLNSDDMLLPNTLHYVASEIDSSKPEILFGNCVHILEGGEYIWGSEVIRMHADINLKLYDYISQPSCFWTRKAWDTTGRLDETLKYAFDWDWFIRALNAAVNFRPTNKYLSIYRLHDQHKSGTGGEERLKELGLIYRRYMGQEYEKLFMKSKKYHRELIYFRRWVKKIRLGKFEDLLLSMTFPHLFLNFKMKDAKEVITMLGPL